MRPQPKECGEGGLPPTVTRGSDWGFWGGGGGGGAAAPGVWWSWGARTLLHVVDEGLQLRVGLGLLPQGVQEHVVLGGARYVCLPQPPLQQPDLCLLLCHLQPLRVGREAWGHPSQPGAMGTPITALPASAPYESPEGSQLSPCTRHRPKTHPGPLASPTSTLGARSLCGL